MNKLLLSALMLVCAASGAAAGEFNFASLKAPEPATAVPVRVERAKAAGFTTQGTVEINSPSYFTRVAALSDVHGMYAQLVSVLRGGGIIDKAGNWKAGKTLLIVAGDSIDKGYNSVDTLDLWIALSAQAPRYGGRVIHLLGNHEAEFLAAPKDAEKAKAFRKELKDKNIQLKEYTHPGHARADFLLAMPAAAKVGQWLFCHAGLMPDMTWEKFARKADKALQTGDYAAPILSDGDSILEAKGWSDDKAGRKALEQRLDAAGMYGVVFGHQPAALNREGASAMTKDQRIVKIDNGMAPEAGSYPGSLLVFTSPAEMTKAVPTRLQTVSPDGAVRPLLPR